MSASPADTTERSAIRDIIGRQAPGVSTLADIPMQVACRIESIGIAVREMSYYMTLGLRSGGFARVLARYPERAPRFIEVEVGNHLVSLPLALAADVTVAPC